MKSIKSLMQKEPGVLYEDKVLMVIDKPSGWIVNNAQTVKDQPVIQSWLYSDHSYPIAKKKELRSGIVHRLDKETSGVLLIAKTENAFYHLQDQFKTRSVSKKYSALVHGVMEKEGNINVPVGRLPWARKRFGILPGGREAETRYRVISNLRFPNLHQSSDSRVISGQTFSLVELYPKTGRTHQIRIHLKYLGHPIVSDEFYAGRKTSRSDRKWCPRLFLHASEITITHPESEKILDVKSDLPTDLKSVLTSLEKVTDKN